MTKVKYLIIIICILVSGQYTFSIAQDNKSLPNNKLSNLQKELKHANKLVSENNFRAAEEFYKEIYQKLDSNKSKKLNLFSKELDNYYHNFLTIKNGSNNLYRKNEFFRLESNGIKYDPVNKNKIDTLKIVINKKVKKYIKYYTGKAKRSLSIFVKRSLKYDNEIKQIFKQHGLDEKLAYLPIIESGYDPFAHSYAYAAGLWQIIAYTGRTYGLNKDWWVDERKNVFKSSNAAAKHLKYLYEIYHNWPLALAAYNCGEGGVNRRIRRHKTRNFWDLWRLPKQTKNYVPKFMAICEILSHPKKYGIKLDNNEIAIHDTLQLDSCVNLKTIADLCETSFEKIKKLNPELKQWLLPPSSKNYPLNIPADKKIGIREKFNKLSNQVKYGTSVLKIKKRQKLKKLADKYLINKQALDDLNTLNGKKFVNKGSLINIVNPPVSEKWFTNFNNKYLTLYDDEKYFFAGRKKIHYRVRQGDSVWTIARKFKVKRKRLKVWNKINSRNIIKPGQRLVIYY